MRDATCCPVYVFFVSSFLFANAVLTRAFVFAYKNAHNSRYMFPANSYSDSGSVSLLLAEIAHANSMIAAAEHVLWTARRSHSEVAILYVVRIIALLN